ncbi:MAG: hypothetical protein ACRD2N_26725 [Vicinamibacterales bacterium]
MRRCLLLAVAALVMLNATRAYGQVSTPGRLYRGLFGGNTGNAVWSQSLIFRAGLGAGYDWGLFVGNSATSGQPAGNQLVSSPFQHGNVGLEYSLSKSRFGISASADAAASHYPTLSRPTLPSYQGQVSAAAQPWSRTSLRATYQTTFQPFYETAWSPSQFGGQQAGPLIYAGQGLNGLLENHTRANTIVGFQQGLSRRVTFSLNYERQTNHSEVAVRELDGQIGRASLTLALFRGLGVRAGYSVAEYRYGRSATTGASPSGSTAYRHENFDGGLYFNRGLSLSRGQMTLSFNTGLAAMQTGEQRQYRVVGTANLSRDFGRRRTGSINLLYDRGFTFHESFGLPASTDRLALNVGTMPNRRVRLDSSAGVVRGHVGIVQTSGGGFENYFTRSGALFGLSRNLGLGVDYSFIAYRYDSGIALAVGPTGRGSRHVVRLNLNLWAPIFQTRGRTNVTR